MKYLQKKAYTIIFYMTLMVVTISDKKTLGSNELCTICCNANASEILKCSHTLCRCCVKKIQATTKICPFCRAPLQRTTPLTNSFESTSKDLRANEEDTETLFSLIRHNHIEQVKEFIQQKGHLTRDHYGNTPLHIAAQNNCKKIIQYLLTLRIQINAKNKKNSTPLDYAKTYNYKKIQALLRQYGALD
jgi:hypothetical protein